MRSWELVLLDAYLLPPDQMRGTHDCTSARGLHRLYDLSACSGDARCAQERTCPTHVVIAMIWDRQRLAGWEYSP